MVLDHIYGRPSVKFSRYSSVAVLLTWITYILRGDRHGPSAIRNISRYLSQKLTAWQLVVGSFLTLYAARRFDIILGLGVPQPLAGMYTRSFFRTTWILTALDAGFWSAMHIKRPWLRHMMSMLLSGYYLIWAEDAEHKVRLVRQALTVEHMRISWNKTLTPPLATLTSLVRPRFMRHPPRQIRIPRPANSPYADPIEAWLYFDGSLSELRKHTKVILDFPGGGFVAMTPRTHDDALMPWAGKTGLPIISLDYRKAPEYPYPYALNECFDSYVSIVQSKGRCIGLAGVVVPEIVLCGDSAGGNFAASTTLMIIEAGTTDNRRFHGENELPIPSGLILVYPALDCNIGNWMSDEQMALIRDPRTRKTNKRVLERKKSEFHLLHPTSMDSDDDEEPRAEPKSSAQRPSADRTSTGILKNSTVTATAPISANAPVKTRLATPSLISYTYDRILTPEMMRAMIILYIGPHARPDFSTDYHLSPVLAPEALLAKFPKTYFLTGERDPLVDDTVIMAGRLRAAKLAQWESKRDAGLLSREALRRGFDVREHVEVRLIEGVSHGFFNFLGIWPEGYRHVMRVGRWFEECFAWAEYKRAVDAREERRHARKVHAAGRRKSADFASSADEDAPLMMTSSKSKAAKPLSKLRTNVAPTTSRHSGSASFDTAYADVEDFEDDPVRPGTPASASSAHPRDPASASPTSQRKSSASFASEDDLLGRRMNGLVGGLTRVEDE